MWGAAACLPFSLAYVIILGGVPHQVEIDCFADYLITGSLW